MGLTVDTTNRNWSPTRCTITVAPGWNDHTIRLEPNYRIRLASSHGGELHRQPLDWWKQLRVNGHEEGHGPFRNLSFRQLGKGGAASVELSLTAPGDYRLLLVSGAETNMLIASVDEQETNTYFIPHFDATNPK